MLKFGFAKEDITPAYGIPLCGYFNPRPNKGAFDRLAIKAAAFETSNGQKGMILSYDLCLFTADVVKRLEKAIADANIDMAGKILFSCTHTHTGPYTGKLFTDDADKDYMDSVVAKTVNVVKEALRSLAPAEMYMTTTSCDTLAYNRRFVMKNGKVLTNPGKLNPDIDHPEGPIDPEIPVMAIKQDGKIVFLMANISNHTDTIGGDYTSADWPGRMEHYIQNDFGYDVPVMTLIAPQGNINHFNVKTATDQSSYEEAKRIGKAYANVLLSCLYQLEKVEDIDITCDEITFEAPYLQVSDAEYNEAKAIYEANKDAVMEGGRDFTSEDIARGVPFVKKFFAGMLIECRENPVTEKRYERVPAIKFGKTLGIVGLPAEPFVEIGLEIKKASPFTFTMVSALTQGEVGYVGLPKNYGIGGYETAPDRYKADPCVGEAFIKYGIEILNK